MGLGERLGRPQELSASEQRQMRFVKLKEAVEHASSAETIADFLKNNELGIHIDLETSRNPNYQKDPTTEDLLYAWANLSVLEEGEVTDALNAVQSAVLNKLEAFNYQAPE